MSKKKVNHPSILPHSLKSFFPIDEIMVRAMTDPQSFFRGNSYQKEHMVLSGEASLNHLTAQVLGSTHPKYNVEITLKQSILSGSCPALWNQIVNIVLRYVLNGFDRQILLNSILSLIRKPMKRKVIVLQGFLYHLMKQAMIIILASPIRIHNFISTNPKSNFINNKRRINQPV